MRITCPFIVVPEREAYILFDPNSMRRGQQEMPLFHSSTKSLVLRRLDWPGQSLASIVN